MKQMLAVMLGASMCAAGETPVVERVDSMTNCCLRRGAVFAFSTNLYEVKAEELFLDAATNLGSKAGFGDELERACKEGAIRRLSLPDVGMRVEGGWLVARPGGKWALVDDAGRFVRDLMSGEEAEGAGRATGNGKPP